MNPNAEGKQEPKNGRVGGVALLLAGVSMAVGISVPWYPVMSDVSFLGLLLALALAVASKMVEGDSRSALVAFRLAAVGLVIGFVYSTTSGRHHHPHEARFERKSCFANQITIAGAIDMYNLDKKSTRKDLDEKFLEDLRAGGYLQSVPSDPGQGEGSLRNYSYSETAGGITCSVHGFGGRSLVRPASAGRGEQ